MVSRPVKYMLIGCGGAAVVGVLALVAGVVWISSLPQGGVKLANEMDEYALEYIDDHHLLEPGEELLAYYDVTLRMTGKEAALLTDRRVLYHKDGRTTALPLAQVEGVEHRDEGMLGDVIEVHDAHGRTLKIVIAPANLGESFAAALDRAWRKARPLPADTAKPGAEKPLGDKTTFRKPGAK